jgi:thioredoxin 1
LNFKLTLRIIAIISLVVTASYIFTQKSVKEGAVCPPTPPIKQSAQRPVPETKMAVAGIKVTFVELGSMGCAPCIMMAKVMDDIEKEYEGQVLVRFHDVNSILGRPYAQKYGIRVIPTQVFLDMDGNEYYRHEGFFPKADLVKVLQMKGVK